MSDVKFFLAIVTTFFNTDEKVRRDKYKWNITRKVSKMQKPGLSFGSKKLGLDLAWDGDDLKIQSWIEFK